jgi:hypothetical protein
VAVKTREIRENLSQPKFYDQQGLESGNCYKIYVITTNPAVNVALTTV